MPQQNAIAPARHTLFPFATFVLRFFVEGSIAFVRPIRLRIVHWWIWAAGKTHAEYKPDAARTCFRTSTVPFELLVRRVKVVCFVWFIESMEEIELGLVSYKTCRKADLACHNEVTRVCTLRSSKTHRQLSNAFLALSSFSTNAELVVQTDPPFDNSSRPSTYQQFTVSSA